jgi:hypothetical protein
MRIKYMKIGFKVQNIVNDINNKDIRGEYDLTIADKKIQMDN